MHKREIEAYLSDPHKKAADLREAYEIAKDPEEWNEEQNKIVRKAEAKGEDEEEEDMLEEEEEAEEKPAKKRKVSQSDGHVKKAKVSSSSSNKKPTSAKTSVPRKSVGTEEADGEDGEHLDPETKKVRSWRHSLQRGFLSKDRSINPDDMDGLNKTMELVEEYDGITRDILRLTKIGKVMRRIIQLEDIPRESEFKFKERAEKLCDEWAVSTFIDVIRSKRLEILTVIPTSRMSLQQMALHLLPKQLRVSQMEQLPHRVHSKKSQQVFLLHQQQQTKAFFLMLSNA